MPCHFEKKKNLSLPFFYADDDSLRIGIFSSTISAVFFLFPHLQNITKISLACTSKWCLRISNVWHGKWQKNIRERTEKNVFSLLRCTLCRTFTYYMLSYMLQQKIQNRNFLCICTEKFVTLYWKVLNYFHVTSLLTFF